MNKKILHDSARLLLMGFITLSLSIASKAQTAEIIANPGTSQNIVTGSSGYHISESIFLESEIGAGNFISAGTAITRIEFSLTTPGAPTSSSSYSIYLQNAPSTTVLMHTGPFSTAGYTQVYTGTLNAATAGWVGLDLTTPFVRTAGSNLLVLITRLDGVAKTTPYVWAASVGTTPTPTDSTTRRYNAVAAPTATQTLTASLFREAIRFIHVAAADAALTGVNVASSCYSGPFSLTFTVNNMGASTPIAAGAATVSVSLSGANTGTANGTNAAAIPVGGSGTVTVSGINASNPGINSLQAIVSFAGDANPANDTLKASFLTDSVVHTYPATETVEDTLPYFHNLKNVSGTNAWTLSGTYANGDMADSLHPHGGAQFFLYDSYNAAAGSSTVLYSNCFDLAPPATGNIYTLTFYMSHDTLFTSPGGGAPLADSMDVLVSADKGVSWTKIASYARLDPTFAVIGWRQQIIDLNAYAGQTIQIGFRARSAFGNVMGLDDITVTAPNIIPVTFFGFSGQREGTRNMLSWITVTETNNSGFELQRSPDGVTFSRIGFIPTKAENGTSNARLTYNFADNNPFASTTYYRLKQIDRDGKSKLSNIVMIKGNKTMAVSIAGLYPNPTRSILNFVVASPEGKKAMLVVTDMAGKIVKQVSTQLIEGDNNLQMSVSEIAKGTYTLKVVSENDNRGTNVKFVKQ